MITHGGKLTHCVARGEVEYDDAGQPIRFTGTLQDVSERKLAEERIRRQLVEKDLLLTEIHHRMKNNIGSIVGLLTLQRDAVSSPEAAMILQEAIGRVESMRLIYDRLLIDRNYAAISTGEYLEAIIDSVVGFFPDHEEITCEKSIDDFPLDSRTMFSLGLVINELLTNIMKYGFTGADRKLVQIKLSRTGNHVALILQDRGRGYPEGFDQESPTGFGITLVKMLAQEIGGTFAATNEEGAKAVLEFDIS